MTGKNLTREFIAERDLKMFRMRQAGASHSEIAKRYEISVSVVSKGISRILERLNRDAALAYPEVLRLELERLDNLQSSVFDYLMMFRQIAVELIFLNIQYSLVTSLFNLFKITF